MRSFSDEVCHSFIRHERTIVNFYIKRNSLVAFNNKLVISAF